MWHLAVLQAVAGAAGGLFAPASTALVPQTVSRPRLEQGNALLSLSQSVANVFGPAVSGAIVAAAGPGWAFAIDAATFLSSVAFLGALRVDDHVRARRQRFWRDFAEGWDEVRRHRWLTAGFLGFALGNVGIGMYFVLGPLVARDLPTPSGASGRGGIRHLGGGCDPDAGARAAAPDDCDHGCERHPQRGGHRRQHALGDGLQQEVRPDRLARVGSIDWLLSLCLMPAGQTLAGPLAEGLGVRGTLVLAAG